IPAVVTIGLLLVWPIGWLIITSFTEPQPGLANYDELITSATVVKIFVRTLQMATTVSLVCLAIGYPYAYTLTLVNAQWRSLLMIAVLAPLWTSLMARAFAWVTIFGKNGLLTTFGHWI